MFDFKQIGEAGKVMAQAATDMNDGVKEINVHLTYIEAYMEDIIEFIKEAKKESEDVSLDVVRSAEQE